MANRQLPTPEVLRQLLRYEADTGKLFWIEKSEESVASERQSTRQRIARNWNARFSGREAFTAISKRGYHVGVLECRRLYAHRVAWAIYYGVWPTDMIDHINGDPLDNRICNLREVSCGENLRNQRLHDRNKTGHHGVWFDKRRNAYQVYITHNGTRIRLGRKRDLQEAIALRRAAEAKYGFHENHGRPKLLD